MSAKFNDEMVLKDLASIELCCKLDIHFSDNIKEHTPLDSAST